LVAALPHRFRGFFNTLDSKKIAIACAKIADDKKAQDIVILDVDKISSITDYFVICSAINERQLHAIADDIDKEMKKVSVKKLGMEGYREGKWVLIDYGDFIVHIFEKEIRSYYDLELLWGDAPKVTW
jgi:ribosome-associated protein